MSHIKDSENLNLLSFLWQSVGSATISIKINCLSSEFAAKKHGAFWVYHTLIIIRYFHAGGEKGAVLQVSIDFYSGATEDHLQRSGCNIKVFIPF